MTTDKDLEEMYKSSFQGPFPYQDCRLIAKLENRPLDDLVPELDSYFATIAGYSSSATRLKDRDPEDLLTAEKTLSKNFFERFPKTEIYQSLIDPQRTPVLYRQMAASELLRVGLLQVLMQIRSR